MRAPVATSDHPRACGEHHLLTVVPGCSRGSSPRLRGTQRAVLAAGLVNRIIPAPAGNTATTNIVSLASSDHPRACGEHKSGIARKLSDAGSSPRLRGTREMSFFQLLVRRIIPAPAGNTTHPSIVLPTPTDHPRACGEHGKRYTAEA